MKKMARFLRSGRYRLALKSLFLCCYVVLCVMGESTVYGASDTVTIRARGTYYYGWPIMYLYVNANGKWSRMGSWRVRTSEWNTYSLTRPYPDDISEVAIVFTNQRTGDNGEAITLSVDYIELWDGTIIQAEDESRGIYDRGDVPWCFDGQDIVSVREYMEWEGALQLRLDPRINRTPQIAPIGDRAIEEQARLDFTVSATDPDGDLLSYSTAGLPQGAAFNTGSGAFTWIPDETQSGSYDVTFTATDGYLTAAETITITVIDVPINQPPLPDAGPDQVVDAADSVILDGSGSADPDGDTLSYSWSQISGTPVSLTGSSSSQAGFTAPNVPADETLTFGLTVDDGNGKNSTDSLIITVRTAGHQPPHGNRYYVDSQAGLDSNSGTSEAQPWQTLAPVHAQAFQPGDVICFKRGSSWTGGLFIDEAGAEGNPIVFTAYGEGEKPVFTNPDIPFGQAITIDADWIIVEELLMRDVHEGGIGLMRGADHNIIRNNEVTNVGVGVVVRGQYNVVTHNSIHDLKAVINTENNTLDDYGAIGVCLLDSNNEVSYNTMVNCKSESYDYKVVGGAVHWYGKADNNVVHHNWVSGCDGFILVGTGSARDTVVAYNVSIDNGGFSWISLAGIFGSDVENFRVEHNTIVEAEDYNEPAWLVFGFNGHPAPETFLLRNNIIVINDFWFISDAERNEWDFTHEGNLYYLSSPHSELGFSLGPNEQIADPLLMNIADKNFRLRSGSPAIDAGFDLGYSTDFDDNDVPYNTQPDIGAFEHGANTSPVADPGQDQTADARMLVTLDGSGSTDPDGDQLSYVWIQSSGIPVTLSDIAAVQPTFTAPDVSVTEILTFSLTVDDGHGGSDAGTVNVSVQPHVSPPPVAESQDVTVDEDTSLPIRLAGSDPEGNPLSYFITAAPVHGTLSGTAPDVAYTPDADWHGADLFTFTVNNGALDSDHATVAITVHPVNDPPRIAPLADITVSEGETVTLSPVAHDMDGDTVTFSYAGWMNASTYTTTYEDAGSHDVTVTVSDGSLSDSATVMVTVTNVNRPPVLTPEGNKSVHEGELLRFTVTATDPDDDPLVYGAVGLPAGAHFDSDTQEFQWTPAYDQSGSYDSTFVVSDPEPLMDSEIITITVIGVNSPPTANAGPDQVTTAETPVTLDGSASTDPDGDTLSYAWIQTAGSPVMLYNVATSQATFTAPDVSADETLSFSLTVADGSGESDTDMVDVTVRYDNHRPVAERQDIAIDEDTSLPITLTGSDPDGDPVSFAITADPRHGTLAGNAPAVTYTPQADWNGIDSFTFIVSDGTLDSDRAPVNITVRAINDPPVAAFNPVPDTGDTPLEVNFYASDSYDPDGTIADYTWIFGDGATAGGTTVSHIYHVYENAGTYSVTLTVTDNEGATDSITASIVVTESAIRGTGYYVDSTAGSDSNPGTSETQPWQTLGPVHSHNFQPGDVIHFKRGSTWTDELVINDSGEAGNPIVFTAYGSGNTPVFSNPGVHYGHAVTINADWVIVEGLLVRDVHEAGIYISNGSDHNIIRTVEATAAGIGIAVYGQYNLITQNYLHDLTMVINTQNTMDDDYGAVAVWLFNSNNEVSYNTMVNCKAPSYDYEFDGGAVEWWGTVDNSYVHHNSARNCDGFLEVGGGSAKNTVVAYNVSVNNKGFAWIHLGGAFGSDVDSFRVENNTIVEIEDYAEFRWILFGFGGQPAPNTFLFRNNIVYLNEFWFVSDAERNMWNFTHENNVYYLLHPWSELGFSLGPGEEIADPLFVDMNAEDFRLQTESPAIDAAMNLGHTLDFDNRPVPVNALPDIGAFEHSSAPGDPGTIITVDNSDPVRFSLNNAQETWHEYVDPGGQHYGQSHHYNGTIGTGQDTATWSFTVPQPGYYDVYAWWWADPLRPTDVPYTISHYTGETTIRVNQQIDSGQWNLLGRFYFEDEGSVTVSDEASSGGFIAADAIQCIFRP